MILTFSWRYCFQWKAPVESCISPTGYKRSMGVTYFLGNFVHLNCTQAPVKSKHWHKKIPRINRITRFNSLVFKATDHFYEIVMRFNFSKMRMIFHLCKLCFCLQAQHCGFLSYRPLKMIFFFFFFPIYLLIITLNNYSYNTTEKKQNKTKQNTLTIDINRVKQD